MAILRGNKKFNSKVLAEIPLTVKTVRVTPALRAYIAGICRVHRLARAKLTTNIGEWEEDVNKAIALVTDATPDEPFYLERRGTMEVLESQYFGKWCIGSRKEIERKNSLLEGFLGRFVQGEMEGTMW